MKRDGEKGAERKKEIKQKRETDIKQKLSRYFHLHFMKVRAHIPLPRSNEEGFVVRANVRITPATKKNSLR